MDAKMSWYAYRGTEEWNLCYILLNVGWNIVSVEYCG